VIQNVRQCSSFHSFAWNKPGLIHEHAADKNINATNNRIENVTEDKKEICSMLKKLKL
jgi:hypothetical protein